MRFPEVTGTSLEGRRFRLPGDFDGRPTVALVAFQRRQQSDVETWVRGVDVTALGAGDSTLRQ